MDTDEVVDVYDDVRRAILRFREFQDERGIPTATQFGFIKAVFDNAPTH